LQLCYNSGHPWRAALLEGWKLFHNPNIENDANAPEKMGDEIEKYRDIEGNSNRDLWKASAIEYCKKVCLHTEKIYY
jgi:nuclear pore complex protein Nup107